MSTSKQDKLTQLTLELETRFGANILRTAKNLGLSSALAPIKTGFPKLDQALGGGFLRDHLTEMMGTGTSGIRTLAVQLLDNAQVQQQDVVYIDYEHSFSPLFAAEHGVDCSKVLLVHPTSHQQGLSIVRDMLSSKEAGLLIYDAGDYSISLRSAFQAVDAQINSLLSGSGCAFVCLISNGRQVAPPLSAFAALRIHVEHVKWLRKLQDVTGYRVRVHIQKNKQSVVTKSIEITISVGVRK